MAKKQPICYSIEREYLAKFTAKELISRIIQTHIKNGAGIETVLHQGQKTKAVNLQHKGSI